MGTFTFRKEERLSKEKIIQELFSKGSSFYLFPFRIAVMRHPEPDAKFHQVLISVSRRNFKRAIDRNLVKRRMRESYRLLKNNLPGSPKIIIAFTYVHKDFLPFEELKVRMKVALERIPKNLAVSAE